jgi:5-methyltetrahydrofolate--homocysteine methyltransferase
MVKEFGAAVIGLTMDESGISKTAEQRLEIARKIVARAEEIGISLCDVIIDSLAMAVGADTKAGQITIETIRMVRNELGVNQTLGASNISFGMPDRRLINRAFLSIIIASGVNCPIVDTAKARPVVLAVDLALGLDNYASRYISFYRARKG